MNVRRAAEPGVAVLVPAGGQRQDLGWGRTPRGRISGSGGGPLHARKARLRLQVRRDPPVMLQCIGRSRLLLLITLEADGA